MEMLIRNQDTQLFTSAFPNRDKETLILLHGGPGVPNGLTFLVQYLARYFQVISFHQRGTLKSPNPSNDYSLEAYNSDINRIAELFQLEKFHLLGHSWGGLYAQVYAQQNPDRLKSLFLGSPASGTGKQWVEMSYEVAKYNKAKCSFTEWMAMLLHSAAGGVGSDSGYRKFYRQALENFSRGFKESHPEAFALDCVKAKAINQTVKEIISSPLLSEMPQPEFKISIVYGDQDIMGESRQYVLERYPTASTYVIPNSGHIPWSHNQKAFVEVLKTHYGI